MHSKAPEFTTINLFWSDPYNFLDGQILAKVIITLLYSANLLFGTILLLAIIYHEKYGEDPQKRSTLNQLLSQMCWIVLIHYWIIYPLQLWRMNIGPVNSNAQWAWWFVGTTMIVSLGLATVEYMAIKYLTIAVYKHVLPIIDDFFAQFLGLANVIVAGFLALANCYTEEGYINLNRGTGLPPKLATYKKFQPGLHGVMVNTVFVSLFFVTIRIKLIKRKTIKKERLAGNTSVYNKDLVQNIFLFVICLFGILSTILGLSGSNIEMFEEPSTRFAIYFLSDMVHALFSLTIAPGIMVASSSEIRKSMYEAACS